MPNCCWWEVFYWEDSMNFTCSRHLPGDEWPTRRPAGGKPFHLGPVGWSQSAPLCGPPAEQSAQRTGAGGCLQMPGVHRSRVTNGLYQNGEKPLYSVHFIIRHARFPEMAWIQAQTHHFQAIMSRLFLYKAQDFWWYSDPTVNSSWWGSLVNPKIKKGLLFLRSVNK